MNYYIIIGLVIIVAIIVFYCYISMKPKKIVVFDMDETLGYFVQLGALYEIISSHSQHKINQTKFNRLISLYPEILRPNIMNILEYVKNEKVKTKCKVYIYTNNQGPNTWSQHIVNYFEGKLGYKLFNDIINAYMINGELNDKRRTTHKKTYDELREITDIATNTRVCFLDDQFHSDMLHKNVYYIRLPKFIHVFDAKEMVERFVNSALYNEFFTLEKAEAYRIMSNELNRYNFTADRNTNISKAHDVTDKVVSNLKEFFERNSNTRKIRKQNVRKTRKKEM